MTAFSDEILLQFLDGETDDDTTRRIEAASETDPQLAARLEVLAAPPGLADETLRAAIDDRLGPIPRALDDTVKPTATAQVLPFRARTPRAQKAANANAPRGGWVGWAAACAAALVVGVAGGRVWGPRETGLVGASGAAIDAKGALNAGLIRASSGTETRVANGVMTVALSFRAEDGRLCRQFTVKLPKQSAAGVACREDDAWRIEGWSAAPARAQGYSMAAGPEDGGLGAVVDRLGVRQTLDADAERRAIAEGWKR